VHKFWVESKGRRAWEPECECDNAAVASHGGGRETRLHTQVQYSISIPLIVWRTGWAAEAILQSLALAETEGRTYALSSTEGEGPGSDEQRWRSLFLAAS